MGGDVGTTARLRGGTDSRRRNPVTGAGRLVRAQLEGDLLVRQQDGGGPGLVFHEDLRVDLHAINRKRRRTGVEERLSLLEQ
ncbi:MAG: hypothetical protein ABR972_01275 [Acidimicrobiales bacterium]|jgi:hypothetical protein